MSVDRILVISSMMEFERLGAEFANALMNQGRRSAQIHLKCYGKLETKPPKLERPYQPNYEKHRPKSFK